MKTINQTGITALIRERLEQPEPYADKTLFIWQVELLDGIQLQLVNDTPIRFNKANIEDTCSHFHILTVRDRFAHLN